MLEAITTESFSRLPSVARRSEAHLARLEKPPVLLRERHVRLLVRVQPEDRVAHDVGVDSLVAKGDFELLACAGGFEAVPISTSVQSSKRRGEEEEGEGRTHRRDG